MRSAFPASILLAVISALTLSCGEREVSGKKEKPDKVDRADQVASAPTGPEEEEEKPKKRPRLSPTLDLLPSGSTLNDISIPRYDEEMRRAALLRAGLLEVISEDQVSAENVELRVFDSDEKQTVRVHMGAAEFFRESSVLEASEILTINGDGFRTRGSAALFHLETRQGFIPGRVYTTFQATPSEEEVPEKADKTSPDTPPADKETPPSPPPPPIEDPAPLAPAPLSAEQLEKIADLLGRPTGPLLADATPTREIINRSQDLGSTSDLALLTLAGLVQRPNLFSEETIRDLEPPRPFEDIAPEAIAATSRGGMYFDANRGIIVYRDQIEVVEPRFKMTARDQVRVFLDKRKSEKAKTEDGSTEEVAKDEKPVEGPENFAEVNTILATGGVRVERKDPKGNRAPVIATADTAIFDAKTGDIILLGGYPSIQQGESFLRAEEPGLYLRILENGEFLTERGRWVTQADLAQLRKKKEDQEEAAPDGGTKKPEPGSEEAVAADQAADKNERTIRVSCRGGMSFDAGNGQVVYHDRVEVTDPGFRMRCQRELRIFLERKPEAEADGLEGPEAFSDVRWIVATGGVTVERTDPEGKREPVIASAETAIYDSLTGEVILRGGTPTIKQGPASLTAGRPDLYLRFYQDGAFFAEEGPWNTVGDLANLRREPGTEPKPAKLIRVTCEGGLYFDTSMGQIVYLRKVRVIEPRFDMTCQDELKIYLSRKKDAAGALEGPEAFADVSAIIANGGVRVVREDPKGKRAPVVATSAVAKYDAGTGNIDLIGGFPKVQQGPNSLRAGEPGLSMTFKANGNVVTERGKWITEGNVKDLRDKDK